MKRFPVLCMVLVLAACASDPGTRTTQKNTGSVVAGAVVGGLVLGLLEAFAAGYVSSQYKDAVAFIVILAVLFVMPNGLFGRTRIERV